MRKYLFLILALVPACAFKKGSVPAPLAAVGATRSSQTPEGSISLQAAETRSSRLQKRNLYSARGGVGTSEPFFVSAEGIDQVRGALDIGTSITPRDRIFATGRRIDSGSVSIPLTLSVDGNDAGRITGTVSGLKPLFDAASESFVEVGFRIESDSGSKQIQTVIATAPTAVRAIFKQMSQNRRASVSTVNVGHLQFATIGTLLITNTSLADIQLEIPSHPNAAILRDVEVRKVTQEKCSYRLEVATERDLYSDQVYLVPEFSSLDEAVKEKTYSVQVPAGRATTVTVYGAGEVVFRLMAMGASRSSFQVAEVTANCQCRCASPGDDRQWQLNRNPETYFAGRGWPGESKACQEIAHTVRTDTLWSPVADEAQMCSCGLWENSRPVPNIDPSLYRYCLGNSPSHRWVFKENKKTERVGRQTGDVKLEFAQSELVRSIRFVAPESGETSESREISVFNESQNIFGTED